MSPGESERERITGSDSAETPQRLIPNKLTAWIAVGLTGWVAALAFRAIRRPVLGAHWLVPLDFLPYWAQLIVNAAFYGYLVFLGVLFFRVAQGRERIVVVGFFLSNLFYPVEMFVAPPAAIAMKNVNAVAQGVAFLAALDILLRTVARRRGADAE